MKRLIFTFICCLLFYLNFYSQNEYITIGKRRNIITDRKIDTTTLASMYTYYYPIFFKVNNNSEYTKVGLYGRKISSHLDLSKKNIKSEFQGYKRNKKFSHLLLTSTITFLSLWMYRGAVYYATTYDNNSMNMYFKNNQYIFFIGYTFSITGSIFFNIRGDKKLIKAVNLHNKMIKSS